MIMQQTGWGHIDWLHMPEEESGQSLTIGITELLPGQTQSSHVHYGQEQFLYILQGQCCYTINGISKDYGPGSYIYIEPDSTHETVNTGVGPLRELLVSNAVSYKKALPYGQLPELDGTKMTGNPVYGAVEAVRSSVLETLRLPLTIFSNSGQTVWQSQNFPAYCVRQCHVGEAGEVCPCLQLQLENLGKENSFICPYGLTVLHLPLLYRGTCLGAIRSGYVLLSDSGSVKKEDLYDTPRSSIISIRHLLQQVIQHILAVCEFNLSRQVLLETNKQLQQSQQALGQVHDVITNVKINHHFLFNILNSQREMALTWNTSDLYDSIINLAKMFRYTMTTDLRFAPLESELEYLTTYLELQKLRYRDGLVYTFHIAESAKSVSVPFNFLQPIVENAFTHGFQELVGKRRITIEAEVNQAFLDIRVYNTGKPVGDVTLHRIRHALSENTGHGLSFIYEKLRSAYGTDFTMDIGLDKRKRTCVYLKLPVR